MSHLALKKSDHVDLVQSSSFDARGRRGRDRMVVGYITTQCNQYLPPLNL